MSRTGKRHVQRSNSLQLPGEKSCGGAGLQALQEQPHHVWPPLHGEGHGGEEGLRESRALHLQLIAHGLRWD